MFLATLLVKIIIWVNSQNICHEFSVDTKQDASTGIFSTH